MPEVRRLLHLLSQPAARRRQGLAWSRWRRHRQASARQSHAGRRAQRQCPSPAAATTSPSPVSVVPGTPPLTDQHWPHLEPLLPATGRPGQPWQAHRRVVEGMLWVMHTGRAWRAIPAPFGAWQTVHSRYQRWQRDGTWARVLHLLHHDLPPDPPLPP